MTAGSQRSSGPISPESTMSTAPSRSAGGRRLLDDADVGLVRRVAGSRATSQRPVGLDAVGAPGAAGEQQRVVPDPGADIGDPLARERDDPLQRGQHLALGVDDVGQALMEARVGIGPGRQDRPHPASLARHRRSMNAHPLLRRRPVLEAGSPRRPAPAGRRRPPRALPRDQDRDGGARHPAAAGPSPRESCRPARHRRAADPLGPVLHQRRPPHCGCAARTGGRGRGRGPVEVGVPAQHQLADARSVRFVTRTTISPSPSAGTSGSTVTATGDDPASAEWRATAAAPGWPSARPRLGSPVAEVGGAVDGAVDARARRSSWGWG